MVNFHDVVKLNPGSHLKLDDFVVFPFLWIQAMISMKNLTLTKKVDNILSAERASERIFGEAILTMESVPWRNAGLPDWGLMDLRNHKMYKLEVPGDRFFFKFPKQEEEKSVLRAPYFVSAEGTVTYSTDTAFEERSENMSIMNNFVKGKFPLKLKKYILTGREITTSIPVEEATWNPALAKLNTNA